MDTKKLRQKILDLAIHGKLVPQDPNDEPASVLLERIRAEKEQLIKEGKIKATKKSKTASDTSHYPKEGPWELPKGWVWTMIDDIAFVTKLAGFEYTNYIADNISKTEGVPLFKGKNVQDGEIIYEFESFIPKSVSNELPRSQVRRKCLLTPYVGTLGNIGIHQKDGLFHLGSNVGKIEILNGRTTDIFEEYVKHYLQSSDGYKQLTRQKKATAQDSISIEAIREVLIPIPPREEQRRILADIERWFAFVSMIESSEKSIKNMIDASKALVLDLAIHGKLLPQDPSDEPALALLKRINPAFQPSDNLHYNGVVPKGWLLLTYNDVADYINGRAFKPEEWESNGVPIIRIQNLNEPCASYNYSSGSFERQYHVQEGDLLFAWAASLGVYIWKGQDAWLNQHIFKVTPYSCIDKEYLYFALSASINDFYQKCHGSGMVHITRKLFINMPLLLPPMNEQKRIIKAIKAYYDILDIIVAGLN